MHNERRQPRIVQLDENALNIYTDGSSLPSPRRGGVGFLFLTVDASGNEVVQEEWVPGWRGATNNQMELQAPIEALRLVLGSRRPFDLSNFSKILIYTDSMYVYDNFNKAKFEWPKSRWKTRTGSPVLNTEEWKELIRWVKRADREGIRVAIKWVKGHKRDQFNNRVDKLAKHSARTTSSRPFKHQRVRRKISPNTVELGSVKLAGQVEDIHVVTDSYLRPPHKLYHCIYEVIGADSLNRGAVDKIFSAIPLSAGHWYRVQLNDDMDYPQVIEVLEELEPTSVGTPPE